MRANGHTVRQFYRGRKMSMFSFSRGAKRALVAGGALVIATVSVAAFAGPAATPAPKSAQQPAAASASSAKVPRPVAVTVDPRTTAYLVLDLTTAVCSPHPTCVSSLPAAE